VFTPVNPLELAGITGVIHTEKMENTLALLLNDKSLRWYTVIDGKPQGPLSASEIVGKIRASELTVGSHIWKSGFSNWTRIYDVIDFKCLLPSEPPAALISEIQKATQEAPPPLSPKQKDELRTWFVQLDGNKQYVGPVSDAEVMGHIQAGRITAKTFMWKKGMKDWLTADSIPQWAGDVPKETKNKDKRSAPRKPFEAKILLTDGKEVGEAVCRDISIGGMQLLTPHVPGTVGTKLRLNVTPSSGNGFTCDGEIIRVLEDGLGFSFRFEHLPADAKKAIEQHTTK
jgi:hypothetical protein